MDRYEIFKQAINPTHPAKAAQPQWFWRLVGKNNKIVAQSEGYNRRSQAIAAAERLPVIAATTAIVENLARGE